MRYISHPRIVPDKVEERRYQSTMAKGCLDNNTLIILPTGLGKTIVALCVTADLLANGKVLMLAPTKPLVEQHSNFFSEMLVDTHIGIMTGLMKPDLRADIVNNNDVIVSTPQCIANDLESKKYDLTPFSLIIYDEAHRGTGNYSYVTIAKHCPSNVRCIGLTASPGSDIKKVEEVCDNLSLSKIDMRNDEDPDVSPYVHDTYVKRIEVNMPKDLTDVVCIFKDLLNHYFGELTSLHLTDPNWPVSTKHMLVVGESLQRRLARGEKTAIIFRGLTVQSMCVKLLHAINLAETQGMTALRTYMNKLNEDGGPNGSKGGKELVGRKEYIDAWNIVRDTKVEHPKISKVMSLVSQILNSENGTKVMIFTQYRDTCELLVEKLSSIPEAKVAKLIGQSNGGLKQKEQIGVLDDFRSGKYNVIISTSVGEEGLDITSTNAVIFYEPVPSEIRTIQRRGRTGRKNDGEVFVLVAKGTMDEVFEESSKKKEALMRSRLETLNEVLKKKNPKPFISKGQRTMGEF
jgi:ERCC4-related helicase